MLQRSDKRGRSLLQLLILRDWDNNNEDFLKLMGGIDKEGNRNQERIDLIINTIKSLKLEVEDC